MEKEQNETNACATRKQYKGDEGARAEWGGNVCGMKKGRARNEETSRVLRKERETSKRI